MKKPQARMKSLDHTIFHGWTEVSKISIQMLPPNLSRKNELLSILAKDTMSGFPLNFSSDEIEI